MNIDTEGAAILKVRKSLILRVVPEHTNINVELRPRSAVMSLVIRVSCTVPSLLDPRPFDP